MSYWDGLALVEKLAGLPDKMMDKTAANRPLMELINKLKAVSPEFATRTKGMNHEGVLATLHSRDFDVNKLLGAPWEDIRASNTAYRRVREPYDDYRNSLRQIANTADHATARQNLTRRFSGAHPPKPGEEFIPSTGSPEFTFKDNASQGDILYRGNPVDKTDTSSLFYMSRHPDVASGYATGDAALGGYTDATNKLLAYRKSDFKRDPAFGSMLPEASSDWNRIRPEAYTSVSSEDLEKIRKLRVDDPLAQHNDWRVLGGVLYDRGPLKAPSPRIRNRLKNPDIAPGNQTPDYEAMVTAPMVPEPIAEYTVRRARNGNQIGYALKPVTQK